MHLKSTKVFHVPPFVVFSCFRLVCRIQGKNNPGQDLKIVLEVHEGEVEGRYSIDGTAEIQGFSFVVRMLCLFTRFRDSMSHVRNQMFWRHTFVSRSQA